MRTHGRVYSAIWTNPDFLALPVGPQRLYLFLLSQSDLNQAGLLPLRVKRWAGKSIGYTEDSVRADLATLGAARFVLVDEATEEVLIRTFVRNDQVYKQPKVMIRMAGDAREIESPRLQAALVDELHKLPLDTLSDAVPKSGGQSPREVAQQVVDTLAEAFAEAVQQAQETLSGRVSDTPAEGYAIPPACARTPSTFHLPPSTVHRRRACLQVLEAAAGDVD